MQATIITKFVMDEENNKVYLSIDGDIKNASQNDKENIKNLLSDAYARILGLEAIEQVESLEGFENSEVEIPGVTTANEELSIFEKEEEGVEKTIKLPEATKEPVKEKTVKKPVKKNDAKTAKDNDVELPTTISVGKYKGKTLDEIKAIEGSNIKGYLEFVREKCYAGKEGKEGYVTMIDNFLNGKEGKKTEVPAKEDTFTELEKEIEKILKKDLNNDKDLLNEFALSCTGNDYDEILKIKDEKQLNAVYETIMQLNK